MSNDIPVVDPTTAAREWLAANPDHEVARHVRAALESADRHEMVALEQEKGGGTRVVIATVKAADHVVLTSPDRMTEERIARFIGRYLLLIKGCEIELHREKAEATLDWCHQAGEELRRFRDGGDDV